MGTLTADGSNPFIPAGTPMNYIKANLNDAVKQVSDELQLRGKTAGGKVDWLVGAFWLESEPDGPQGTAVAFGQVPGAPLTAPAYNFIEEKSKAVFGHLSWDLGDWARGLEFEVGL